MLRRAGTLTASFVAVGVALSGCGGSSGTDAAPTPTATSGSPSCPTPASTEGNWPASVPADMPKPPAAEVTEDSVAADGVRVVKFSTPYSLRDSILFVVREFPKAGYVLGRGDAEAAEADAPFLHGDTRGLVRMLDAGPCRTQWLLATINTREQSGGSPLLPTHNTGSPSPLPFG